MPDLATTYAILSERHLEAANLLLNSEHHDSAIFHSFHAFECICRSGLVSYGEAIRKDHGKNITWFVKCSRDQSRVFTKEVSDVTAIVIAVRNPSLYPDAGILPTVRFSPAEAIDTWSKVRGIVSQIRKDLEV